MKAIGRYVGPVTDVIIIQNVFLVFRDTIGSQPYPPDEDISYRCIKKGNKFSIERSSKKKEKKSSR